MKRINQGLLPLLTVFIMTLLLSCSHIVYMELLYRLPTKSDALRGKKIFVSVEDLRTSKDMMAKGARDFYEEFTGNISFSVAQSTGPGARVGIYDVPGLFKEGFIKRLENEGVEVVQRGDAGALELNIALEQFLLDLAGQKWTIKTAFEARSKKGDEVLERQIVRGEGERAKILGVGEGEKLIGEVFTDLVNRVDLQKLFRDAGT